MSGNLPFLDAPAAVIRAPRRPLIVNAPPFLPRPPLMLFTAIFSTRPTHCTATKTRTERTAPLLLPAGRPLCGVATNGTSSAAGVSRTMTPARRAPRGRRRPRGCQ